MTSGSIDMVTPYSNKKTGCIFSKNATCFSILCFIYIPAIALMSAMMVLANLSASALLAASE